jgi:hypothetical protein
LDCALDCGTISAKALATRTDILAIIFRPGRDDGRKLIQRETNIFTILFWGIPVPYASKTVGLKNDTPKTWWMYEEKMKST